MQLLCSFQDSFIDKVPIAKFGMKQGKEDSDGKILAQLEIACIGMGWYP
jgi:hypothetical protein